MVVVLVALWGCIPEITRDCQDMTNASSTYLGILLGAIIGGLVSWWIYNRQQKTSKKQDHFIHRINELEERHDRMLKTIEKIEERNNAILNVLVELDKRITKYLADKS
jgi:Na+/glutamate symporter